MPIKLEYGKKYMCRNGAVVGPLEKNPVGYSTYPFCCDVDSKVFGGQGAVTWMENGHFRISGSGHDDYDIVAEYHEYVWKWMVPDKPGVWAFAGKNRDSMGTPEVIMIEDTRSGYVPGWFCFLMANPLILIPPKQRVTKRLWLKDLKAMSPVSVVSVYEERWEPADVTPEGWIFTNITKEVEQ